MSCDVYCVAGVQWGTRWPRQSCWSNTRSLCLPAC